MMKTIQECDVYGKRVLVRCDLDVPLNEKGEIEDDFRIVQMLPTIRYLQEKKAKIILLGHIGRPDGEIVDHLKMRPIAKKLGELLEVSLQRATDCIGSQVQKQASDLKEGEVLLLENLRFHREEKLGDLKFTQELVELGDFYVNEAFADSHRVHASIVGIPRFLPSAAGISLAKEVKVLSTVLHEPWRPLVAIIGGVKIKTKIPLIRSFLTKADHVLVGGKIADTILRVKGICVGGELPEEDMVKEIEQLPLTSPKLHLPLDVIASPDKTGRIYVRETAPAKVRNDELLLDIGPETIQLFSRIIKDARMIVWSGPLGLFEEPAFAEGTEKIAEQIARNHKAFKIAGGGDTLFALAQLKLRDVFDHVSTGGGAMLSFLSGEELPGLKALE